MKNDQSENWKSAEQRAERKERLQAQRSKDGSKKVVRSKHMGRKILTIVIIVAVLAGIAAMIYLNNGWQERRKTAMVLNDKYNITPLEINYIAGSTFNNNFQTAAFNYTGRNMLTSAFPDPASGEFRTIRESLLEGMGEDLALTYVLYDKAIAEGMEIGEAEEQAFERFKMQITMAANQQQMHPNDLMSQLFGKGASFNALKPILERHFLAARYQNEVLDNYDFSEADFEDEYKENPELYDYVRFHVFALNSATVEVWEQAQAAEEQDIDAPESEETDTEATEAETSEEANTESADSPEETAEEADEEQPVESTATEESPEERKQRLDAKALELAQKMAKRSTSEEKFWEEAMKYAAPEQKELLEDKDATLVKHGKFNQMQPPMKAWLFDEARKPGDTTVISMDGNHAVLYFVERSIDDSASFDSRHILIKDAEDTDEAQAEAKKKSEDILKEYQSGEQSEDKFAELAKKYSEDPGSKERGGLYENITAGSFVKPYEEWCLDSARTAGDVTIVRVEEPYRGYHIIYFVASGDAAWKNDAKHNMANKKFFDELEELRAKVNFEEDEEGMKLVLPYDQAAMDSVQSSIQDLREQIGQQAVESTDAPESEPEVLEGEAEKATEK